MNKKTAGGMMRKFLILTVMGIFAVMITAVPSSVRAEDTELAEPAPSMDTPRQLVLQLNSSDPAKMNAVMSNVYNIQKFYGVDNVQIAVVAWGPGMRTFLKDSPVKERIQSLMMYDVEFVACGNTMSAMHWGEKDLLEGVEVTTAGIPEVVERRLKGWIDITP